MYNIEGVEKELTLERKVYNKRVSWYNTTIQQFPTNLIANKLGFKERSFYARGSKEEAEERKSS